MFEGASVLEGVGCEWMVGRVVWGWSGLMWVVVMIGAWVEPVCVCLRIGKCSYMRAWRGQEVLSLLVWVVAM